jgi:hypothetical protein
VSLIYHHSFLVSRSGYSMDGGRGSLSLLVMYCSDHALRSDPFSLVVMSSGSVVGVYLSLFKGSHLLFW